MRVYPSTAIVAVLNTTIGCFTNLINPPDTRTVKGLFRCFIRGGHYHRVYLASGELNTPN